MRDIWRGRNLIVLNQSAHVFAFGYFLNVGYCYARSDNQSQCGIWSNLPAHGASRSKYGYTFSFIDPGPLSRTIFVSLCAWDKGVQLWIFLVTKH